MEDQEREDLAVAQWVAANYRAIRPARVEVTRSVVETLAPDGSVASRRDGGRVELRVTFDTPLGAFTEVLVGVRGDLRRRILASAALMEDKGDG